MKKTRLFPAVIILVVFFVSCEGAYNGNKIKFNRLSEGSFYAQRMDTGKHYILEAEILANGTQCVIWAEKGSGVTPAKAEEIAETYDSFIRPEIVEAFGKKDFYTDSSGKEVDISYSGQKSHFNDILDYANELAGRKNKKLTILLLDIKDGYTAGSDSYVAGYFSAINFYNIPNSNLKDMIYIDTYPGLESADRVYATLAHELQHLINFVTSNLLGRGLTDTWIDEGLSAQAEYLYYKTNPDDKIKWFINDKAGTIAKGNNFFVWDNHKEDARSILDEYATVYLFFRWLYLQAKAKELHSELFYNISTSQQYNFQAVTDIAGGINTDWDTWENLLGTWLAANYYPDNSYGYTGDYDLMGTIKVNTITTLGNSIELYPGEGVYSNIADSFNPSSEGGNIRYAEISGNSPDINTLSPFTRDTLITFNASTNQKGDRETGSLAGLSSIVPLAQAGQMLSVEFEAAPMEPAVPAEPKIPYVLDARDVLGRNMEDQFQFTPGPATVFE